MNPKDDQLETRTFEEVLIESIKMTAKLNSQDSMQFYLTNWLSICRTDLEKGPVFALAGEILAECGRSEWVAALFNKEQSSHPSSAAKEECLAAPAQKPDIPGFKGYITPDGLWLFDNYLQAKKRFLEYQNFIYNHYLNQGNRKEAEFRLELMLKLAYFPGEHALYWVKKGALMEGDRNYSAAAEAYRDGLEHDQDQVDPTLNYFLRNNLGYSLNQLGLFVDGETWCREAIETDKNRSNAHKNLGLALQGQGRYPEAAACFRNATLADPIDRRSFNHLRELLETHPDLGITHPEYWEFLGNSKGDH